jgi:hypothetical protein
MSAGQAAEGVLVQEFHRWTSVRPHPGIRGDSRWSIYQGKESDPYGQGCGRRKRNFAAAIWAVPGSRGGVSFAGVAYSKGPVHASVEVRCVVIPVGKTTILEGINEALGETCKR